MISITNATANVTYEINTDDLISDALDAEVTEVRAVGGDLVIVTESVVDLTAYHEDAADSAGLQGWTVTDSDATEFNGVVEVNLSLEL